MTTNLTENVARLLRIHTLEGLAAPSPGFAGNAMGAIVERVYQRLPSGDYGRGDVRDAIEANAEFMAAFDERQAMVRRADRAGLLLSLNLHHGLVFATDQKLVARFMREGDASVLTVNQRIALKLAAQRFLRRAEKAGVQVTLNGDRRFRNEVTLTGYLVPQEVAAHQMNYGKLTLDRTTAGELLSAAKAERNQPAPLHGRELSDDANQPVEVDEPCTCKQTPVEVVEETPADVMRRTVADLRKLQGEWRERAANAVNERAAASCHGAASAYGVAADLVEARLAEL